MKKQIKKYRFFLYVFGLILLTIVHLILNNDSTSIFNQKTSKAQIVCYSDKESKGHSEIKGEKKDKVLQVSYQLKKGYVFPYCGVTFHQEVNSTPYNIKNYQQVQLKLEVDTPCKLDLIFSEHQNKQNKTKNIQYINYTLSCIPEKQTYTVNLKDFKIPGWWERDNKEHMGRDRESINTFSIQHDPTLAANVNQSFQLHEILLREHSFLIYYIGGIFTLLILLTELIGSKNKRIEVNYVPTPQVEQEHTTPWQSILQYITTHYKEEIQLEEVYKATGVPKHKISSSIKENTQMSFRQFINQIRLQEADRLLETTDLSISQIAYEVGYTSISHFNKVYKQTRGQAPNEFRMKFLK